MNKYDSIQVSKKTQKFYIRSLTQYSYKFSILYFIPITQYDTILSWNLGKTVNFQLRMGSFTGPVCKGYYALCKGDEGEGSY